MLLQEWIGIGTDITEKLVDSVRNRLYEYLRMHQRCPLRLKMRRCRTAVIP